MAAEILLKQKAWKSVAAGNQILDNIGTFNLPESERLAIFKHLLARDKNREFVLSKADNFKFSKATKLQIVALYMQSLTDISPADYFRKLVSALRALSLVNDPDRFGSLINIALELEKIDKGIFFKIALAFAAFCPIRALEQMGQFPLTDMERVKIAVQIAKEKPRLLLDEGLSLCNFSEVTREKIVQAKNSSLVEAALYNSKNEFEDPIFFLAYQLKYEERRPLITATMEDLQVLRRQPYLAYVAEVALTEREVLEEERVRASIPEETHVFSNYSGIPCPFFMI